MRKNSGSILFGGALIIVSLAAFGCGGGDDRTGDPDAASDESGDDEGGVAGTGEGGGQAAGDGGADAPPDLGDGEGEGEGGGQGPSEGEGEDEEPPNEGGDEGAGEGPVACDPPLNLDPFEAAIRPLDLLTLRASGGTGAYEFTLTEAPSGALLNPVTGAYLSGEVTGVIDKAELRDGGCLGVARAEIRVVRAMEVRPLEVELALGAAFTFEVSEGSGQFAFLMAASRTGGGVTAEGRYTAGPSEGDDVIKVTDIATGEEAEVFIRVVADARLAPQPSEVFVALGSSHRLVVAGGSGFLDAAMSGAAVGFEDGVVKAMGIGVSHLSLTDHFTGAQTDVRVTTLAPKSMPQVRAGNAYGRSPVVRAGDIDGDGFDDVVVGWPEADVEAFNGGAIFIYAGGDPPAAAPVRVISSQRRRTEMGRSVVVADFDGDGLVDLAVGAPLDDVGTNDNGAIYIYAGQEGAFFADTPRQALVGPFAGDRYGHSLVACDFNGDGRLDLATGAFLAEDRDADRRSNNQGAVFVHLGHPDGFLEEADDRLYGQSPDEQGEWRDHDNLRLGWSIAAADFDGDGKCDLVAGSIEYRSVQDRPNDGAAFLYRGRAAAGLSQGGLEPRPAYALAGSDPDDRSSQLGRQVAMGDLDGDGLAEVILGQYRSDNPDAGSVDHGAVRILRGRRLPAGAANRMTPAGQLDWVLRGAAAYDNVGWSVGYDPDPPTLLVSALNGEDEDGPVNTGSLTLIAGLAGALPDPNTARVVSGEVSGVRYGQNGRPVGDMDGDGADDLFVIAGYGSEYGYRVGTPWFIPGGEGLEPRALELPGEPSGAEIGRAIAFVPDLDGDGFDELVVGAPRFDTVEQGFDPGAAFLFRGGPDGFSSQPDLTLVGHPGHSGFDLFGQGVGPAGDFDGDGKQDLAILARSEDRPNNFIPAFSELQDCGGPVNDAGAVLVYRGRQGALPDAVPSFAIFGPARAANPERMAGGLDIDGDGRGDIVFGSRLHDTRGVSDSGSVSVAWGRPYVGGGLVQVGCATEVIDEGVEATGWLGWGLTTLGDINGDGCDDFAAAAPRESPRGIRREGIVRVYFGWGGARCPEEPTWTVIGGGEIDGLFGWDLAGGVDIDGDGIPDMAVSALGRVGNVANIGGAWVVSGSWMASLPRSAVTPGRLAAEAITTVDPGVEGARRISGDAVGQQFGSAVALLHGAEGGGRLALGAALSGLSGTSLSGGVRVHAVDGEGLRPEALAEFGGEAGRPEGRLGDRLAAGRLGARAVLAVGGYDANGAGLDLGAVYVLILD